MKNESQETMILEALPALGPLYIRAALQRRKPPKPSTTRPDLAARVRRVDVDPHELDAYRQICGIAADGFLPPTFPQVLATPLHAAIVARRDFPLPALGMVHVENRITQHRPIEETATLDMECRMGGWKWDERLGMRFAIDTAVRVMGELVWESRLWALSRGKREDLVRREKSRESQSSSTDDGEATRPVVSVIEALPADLGRRYAAVCGDYNPIHLHKLTSRPFGFRRPIIHGMWTLARCWGVVGDEVDKEGLALTVRFKKPVYLPSKILIKAVEKEGGLEFSCQNIEGDRIYLTGRMGSS